MATSLPTTNLQTVDREKIYLWINELTNPETRESALFELRYRHFSNLFRLKEISLGSLVV